MRKLELSNLLAGLLIALPIYHVQAASFASLLSGTEPPQAFSLFNEEPERNVGPSDSLPARGLHVLRVHRTHTLIPKEDHDAIKEASKTTGILHDKTLRSGDIVMTESGIRVFEGSKSATHSSADFKKISDARNLSPELRRTLVAINARSSPILWQTGEAEPLLITRRSGSTQAHRAADKDGHSIRRVDQ